MTDEPTDEALENLFVEETGFDIDDFPAAILDFARAVLAKWGQPAQAGEPFCWHWENTFNGGTGTVKKNPETLGINMVHPDHKWTALYTAPQPTQTQPVAREPLSHAQAKALVLKYGNDPLNLVFQVELAQGIKGGQS